MRPSLPLLPALFIVSALSAQVPRGWAVASQYADTAAQVGGLAMFHPIVPGAPVPITGALPAAITGAGLTRPCGAGCVLVDGAGNLVVGTHGGPNGLPVQVFLLTLSGSTVVASTAYTLGTSGGLGFGSTDQMAWVGGDILVSNRAPMASGPLANASLGWVRPRLGPPGTPGTVVPIATTTAMNGVTNALAVDRQGQFAFLGRFAGSGPYTSLIYKIPLTGTGPVTPILLTTIPDAILNLAVRPDGILIAAVGFRAASNVNALHVIDPGTGMILASSPGPNVLNALAMDTATGDLLIGDWQSGQVLRSSPLFFSYTTPTLVTTCPVSIDGIAIRPALDTFGDGSGPDAPAWIMEPSAYGPVAPGPPPNPGIPTIGSATFSIAVTQMPYVPSVFAIAFASSPPWILPAPFGVTAHVPASAELLFQVALPFSGNFGDPSGASVSLPIPNLPALAGLDVFAQAFTVDANGTWSASAGLQFTLF